MVRPIPEEKLRACLAVLYRACIDARRLGYEGQRTGLPPLRAELLADLMDAVHNIPQLLLRWPDVDESLLRGVLSDFDRKWPDDRPSLVAVFDDALAEPGA